MVYGRSIENSLLIEGRKKPQERQRGRGREEENGEACKRKKQRNAVDLFWSVLAVPNENSS